MTACVCTKLGLPPTVPTDTGVQGYPIAGEDPSYSGLCSFDCNHGYCPSNACGTVEVTLTIPTVSDFAPETCTGGEGSGDFDLLCGFACGHGFCPIHVCNCTSTGALDDFPIVNASATARLVSGFNDYGLCDFVCERDNCYLACEAGDTWSWSDELSCSDNDTRSWCDIAAPCDYNLTFTSLDELSLAESENMADACVDFHMLTVLYNMIDEVVANYTDIIENNNYNKTFGYYTEYIEGNITATLANLMSLEGGAGNAFFECTPQVNGVNRSTTSCPWSEDSGTFKVYYDLINATGWWAMLDENGIQESWVKFGTTEDREACSPYQDKIGCLSYDATFIGIPLKSDNVNITDPRTIVANALPQLDNLQSNILAAQLQTILGAWPGYSDDIVQSISLSVELLMQAISSMQTVVDIGEEQQALDKKKLVDDILMAVFLVVPFLGEVDIIGGAFADLARIMTVVGDVSTVGYTVYAIADNPKEALPIIFETLLLSGQRTPDEFGTMAAARRKITDKTVSSLGSVFEHQNTVIGNLIQDCVRG